MKPFELPQGFDPCGLWHPPGDLQALAELARNHSTPGGLAVEVGSYAGASALAIASGAADLDCRILCVDHFQGNEHDCLKGVMAQGRVTPRKLFRTFCRNVGPLLFDKVFPLVATSEAAAEAVADGSCDLVFVDAEHTYGACGKDVALWLPKVRPGGVLCGHDYAPQFPGVVKAVNELFAAAAAHKPDCGRVGHSVWFHKVPG